MRPVLLAWHGIRIYSYPVLLYAGMVLGIVASNHAAHRAGLDPIRVLVAMVLLTIPGLVGARLLFVVTYWPRYRRAPGRIWRRSEGGAAMQGGLLLALATSLPLLRALGVPMAAFWDVATFTMLIALVFARVGCLLHGCCGGRPTDGRVALFLPDHRGVWRRRVPTQLLEAGLALLLLVGTVGISRERLFPGAVFLAAVIAYALGRLVLEPMREVRDRLGALDVQQAIAGGLGALALIGFLVAWLGAGPNP